MSDQAKHDICHVLDQASQLKNTTWKCWVYTATSKILVLCAYRPAFSVVGYMVFRAPSYVCLPWVFEAAEFHRLDSDAPGEKRDAPRGAATGPLFHIAIRSEGREFRVVCEGVAFYQIDP
jgi:hypothetical protein